MLCNAWLPCTKKSKLSLVRSGNTLVRKRAIIREIDQDGPMIRRAARQCRGVRCAQAAHQAPVDPDRHRSISQMRCTTWPDVVETAQAGDAERVEVSDHRIEPWTACEQMRELPPVGKLAVI